MAERIATFGNHTITVSVFSFPASKVTYDGNLVLSIEGKVGVFHVNEDGEDVQYDIEIKPKFFTTGVIIRRNGRIIYSD